MIRPTWDQYFMQFAHLAATRSTCTRRKVGAVIVKNRQILATGYNGAPKGIEHCESAGCIRKRLGVPSGERHELCRGVHAEQNAIIQAACHGVSVMGGELYCTNAPCVICSKMIINSGIVRVVYSDGYGDATGEDMLGAGGVVVERVDLP